MSCICPGCFNVWVADGPGNTWEPLLHIDSWEVQDDVEEAPRKRTSSTNGQSNKFCSDIVGYDIEFVTTLCSAEQWIFCQTLNDHRILANGRTTWWFFGWDCDYSPATLADATTGADKLNAGTNLSVATVSAPAGAVLGTDAGDFQGSPGPGGGFAPDYNSPGVLAYGQVRPPGFGGDNTGNDVATASFTVNVSVGPFMPRDVHDNPGTSLCS